MRHRIDSIEEKLKNGKIVFGTHTVLGGAVTAEIYGTVGYDVLWIDAEHGCIDKKDILATIMGAAGTEMATFVRVAWNDMVLAKPILEMGCDGIIFPMVTTAEEARAAVAACTYPPDGIRGFGPYRSLQYGKIPAKDYVEKYSKKIWKVIQIEHIRAVENLKEIAQVDGIDLFVIGPCDLSASMGLLPQLSHPDVKKVMDQIAAELRAAGKPFGVSIAYDEEMVREWIARGASFIFADNDTGYLFSGASATLDNLRRVSAEK